MGGFLKVKKMEDSLTIKQTKQRAYATMAEPHLNNKKEIEYYNRSKEWLKRPAYGSRKDK